MSPRVAPAAAPAGRRSIRLRAAHACALVIFGATGDLTRRKLMPALFRLARRGLLDDCFGILGASRTELSVEEFRGEMRDAVEAAEGDRFDAEDWKAFSRRLHYHAIDVTEAGAFDGLRGALEEMGADHPSRGNHLFYFSVPPDLAPPIVDGLREAGLTEQGEGWTRVVVEKPFGRDLESARALNEKLASTFSEDQVYRIDHFLGKETVQNILAFRFGNTLFEPVWNRNWIDHVQITAAETLGVGDRAGFYERTGALRDMVANHMLQLLTLTAMEPPVAYEARSIREEKVQVLRSIRPMTPEEVAERTVRGQFGPGVVDGEEVSGYKDLPDVPDDSEIETYAAVEFRIDNWRWAGVPFYVRTGKRLERTVTEIAVEFHRTPHAIFSRVDDRVPPNVIVLRFKPDEGIDVTFAAKVPGEGMRTSRVRMEFDYETAFGVDLPEAYETLLLDVTQGDPTHFTRSDEVEAQWTLITPILEAWEAAGAPRFPNYAAGERGPEAADALLAGSGRSWRPLTGPADGEASGA